VIPIAPAPKAKWFQAPIGTLLNYSEAALLTKAIRTAIHEVPGLASPLNRKQSIRRIAAAFASPVVRLFPLPIQWGIAESFLPTVAPTADINIATGFETVRPTSTLAGRNFYFCQHYEPYCTDISPGQGYAGEIARQSYRLGLRPIANSSWLRDTLMTVAGQTSVSLCPNAINHNIFYGEARRSSDPRKVVVISYGGRTAEWKGFRDMAAAIAIARAKAPHIDIEWRVYGPSLLPPDNPVASYVSLGFLYPKDLSAAYREADILLSASWYESFPLFPIEAMACGLAVITTPFGTEDYAQHGVTAEVVAPRSAESIASGLLRLIEDPEYRFQIAAAGNKRSREFTWERSTDKLESIVTA
jgi:glycosyltransferase involved in cell wall biosynthesis